MTSSGLELATPGFEVGYLTAELRCFACKRNIIVDLELGVGLKLDNFHNFMNSDMQSSVVPNPRVVGSNYYVANFFKCEHYYNVCQDRCKNGADYT